MRKFLKPFYKAEYSKEYDTEKSFFENHKEELKSLGVSVDKIKWDGRGSFLIEIDKDSNLKKELPEAFLSAGGSAIIGRSVLKVRSWESWANLDSVRENRIPCELPEYTDEFFEETFTFPKSLEYENGVILDKSQIKEALFSRVSKYFFSRFLLRNYFRGASYYSKAENDQQALSYIKEMAKHKAYEGTNDGEDCTEELVEEYGYSKEFFQHFFSTRGITEQQMNCDHERVDTFDADGNFYNSVPVCNKCLLEGKDDVMEDESNLEELHSFWEAGLNLRKNKKGRK